MKIFPTVLTKRLDAYTIAHEPIASIDLMERAAVSLADAWCVHFPDVDVPVVLFAGPGNNGGDALALARLLCARGYVSVSVYLFNPSGCLSEDCEENRRRLLLVDGVSFHEVTSSFTPPCLTSETVVVDGLFGSGLTRPLEGGYLSVVKYINASRSRVVSIDVPSGLMGEDNGGNNPEGIVRADLTLTLQHPKLSFFLPDCQPYVGRWEVLDIGLSPEAVRETDTDYRLTEEADVRALLRPRARFAHKGDFGRALLIAGRQGMGGASVLAARACLRSGVGLLTVHVPFCNNAIVQTAVPEAMTEIDFSDTRFSEATDTDPYRAVAVGPGLGQHAETERALMEQLGECVVPMVLDADALNLLSEHHDRLMRLPRGSILTPHVGELERLVGTCNSSYERLQRARELAIDARLHLILKGAYTAVCAPDGRVSFNSTGNPGMATAGSGDVLTGILLALLAQGYPADEAARLGVYVHGLAGDLAAAELGEIALTAGDIVDYLPRAWQQLTND